MASRGEIEAGRAYVRLFVKNGIPAGLKKASAQLKSWGASMQGMGTKISAIGGAIQGIGAKIAAIGGTISSSFMMAIKLGSDVEETMNKFNVVFGQNATAVKEWGDKFGAEIGRSKRQVANFLAGTQDLLVPIGFESGAATEMSKQVTGLAVDLASFNNTADSDALRDLHAALTGSGEVMKKYGVIVSEAAVKQQLLKSGIDIKSVTEQQKVMARWQIILAGTTAAQGDAIRSAGSFANQLKALRANAEDAAAAIGTALLPVVTPLLKKVSEIVKKIGSWVSENRQLVVAASKAAVAVTAIGTGIVALGAVFGGAAAIVAGLGVTLGVVGMALKVLLSPIGLVTTTVVGLGGDFKWMSKVARESFDKLSGFFEKIKKDVLESFEGISNALKAGDMQLATQILGATLKLEWLRISSSIKEVWSGLAGSWETFIVNLAVAWTKFEEFVLNSWERIRDAVTEALAQPLSKYAMRMEVGGESKEVIREDWLKAKKEHPEAFQSISPEKVERMILSGLTPSFDALNQEAKDAINAARKRRLGAWAEWEKSGGYIVDDMTKQRAAQRKAAAEKRAKEAADSLASLSQMREESLTSEQRKARSDAERAIAEAQAELDAITQDAAGAEQRKRYQGQLTGFDSFEREKPKYFEPKPADESKLSKSQELAATVKMSTAGTFNPFAVAGMGASSEVMRMATATEKMSQTLEEMRAEAKRRYEQSKADARHNYRNGRGKFVFTGADSPL